MAPLETDEIRPQDQGGTRSTPLDSAQASFLQIENPNIVLVDWKMAEDNHGTILRLLETAGKAGDVTISSPLLAIESAWLATAMEENQRVLPVSADGLRFAVKPFQVVTLRVETRSTRKVAAAH
jgi:alpha-mannosidase